MSIKEYLDLIGKKITEAEETGNKKEAIRLLRLLATVANEEADKLEK